MYQCNSCRQQFTVTVGTVFESAPRSRCISWLLAFYLLAGSKKGCERSPAAPHVGRHLQDALGSWRTVSVRRCAIASPRLVRRQRQVRRGRRDVHRSHEGLLRKITRGLAHKMKLCSTPCRAWRQGSIHPARHVRLSQHDHQRRLCARTSPSRQGPADDRRSELDDPAIGKPVRQA